MAAAINNAIEAPPRSTGRPEVDGVGALQYLWALYTKAILTGGLLQPQNMDPALISLGDLVGSENTIAYFTAEDTFDLTGFTAFARTLLDDADASEARDTLGAGTVRTVTGTAPIASNGDPVNPNISINDFVASGVGHARGAVPDPGAAAGTAKFLREDATWEVPPGAGDVVGPAGATDGNVVLFDTATGKLVKDGGTLGTAAFADSVDFDAAGAAAAAQAASQPLDTDLTAIAALVSAANKIAYATGAGAWALTDFTAAGRALVDDATTAAQATTLGLGTTDSPVFVTVKLSGLGSLKVPKHVDDSTGLADTTINVTANNEVTNPSQPMFNAQQSALVTNKTGTGSSYYIIFDQENNDQNADYDPSTGIFTAPVDGMYHLDAKVTWYGLTTACTQFRAYILLGGSSTRYFTDTLGLAPSSAGAVSNSVSVTCYMAAGDTARVYGIVNGEAGDTVDVLGSATIGYTYFSGFLAC